MQIPGTYNSPLQQFHSQELLTLLRQAVALGEYQGGLGLDQAIAALQQQSTDFSNLPLPAAGQRALEDSINTPLTTLVARFNAFQSTLTSFSSTADTLQALLTKDIGLLDRLLCAADLEKWCQTVPSLEGDSASWDYGTGYGKISTDISPTDAGFVYRTDLALYTLLNSDGTLQAGLGLPRTTTTINSKNLVWHFTADSSWQQEILNADDFSWSSLSLLLPQPLVDVSAIPTVTPANNAIQVTGQSGLMLPVQLRLQFMQRRQVTTIASLTTTQPVQLTPYGFGDADVLAVAAGNSYQAGVDFQVNNDGTILSVTLPTATPITFSFLEYWPAFQCSIDGSTWSPVVMFDHARPYSDGTTNFIPLTINGNSFAVTDELGNPTGLFVELVAPLTVAAVVVTVGAAEVDLERPAYLTGFHLEPATEYPAQLTQVEVEGFSVDSRTTVWSGTAVLDRQMAVNFPRTMVKKVWLTLMQTNYTIKQYQVPAVDQLRRDTMTSIQASLPSSVQNAPAAAPETYNGFLYNFYLQGMAGEDASTFKGVYVAGAYRFDGQPQIVRVDWQAFGNVDVYLCFRAFNAAGVVLDEQLQGLQYTNGQTIVFPFAYGSSFDPTQVAYTWVYLKIIPRDPNAMMERFLVQVRHV